MAKSQRPSVPASFLFAASAMAMAASSRGAYAFGVPTRVVSPGPSAVGGRSTIPIPIPIPIPIGGANWRRRTTNLLHLSSSPPEPEGGDGIGDVDGGGDPEQFDEVYGAKFFGGTAVKEELFDPKAEDRAAELIRQEREERGGQFGSYDRFEDRRCFEDDYAAEVGRRVQGSIGAALYDDDEYAEGGGAYSSAVDWTTPFSRDKASRTPAEELANAKKFYNRVDAAVVGAKTLDDGGSRKKVALRWEISLVWPNPWEARVLLTGTSLVTVDAKSGRIVSQKDKLDAGGKDGTDIVGAISSQLGPRFWDLYHVGMTPSAELSPRLEPRRAKKGAFAKYELFETPPRLTVSPTMLDTGGRDDRIAQAIPNHAFSTIIKTTGPRKQRFVPVSPVEVRIERDAEAGRGRVSWSIPVSPEFLAAAGTEGSLQLPGPDEETDDDRKAECRYELQPSRLVATMPFGGSPQDAHVADARKELYEAVTRDGLRVKTDERGRPVFFFLQNDCKACYVAEGGLGMAVYEWRPKWNKVNEVGIELEL